MARGFSSLNLNPLRVCVVGSGPAGFYTAEKVIYDIYYFLLLLFYFFVSLIMICILDLSFF